MSGIGHDGHFSTTLGAELAAAPTESNGNREAEFGDRSSTTAEQHAAASQLANSGTKVLALVRKAAAVLAVLHDLAEAVQHVFARNAEVAGVKADRR